MYHLIIDTCVWIDLCKDFPEVRKKITGLVEQEKIRLILPKIIIDEWNRHKHPKIITSKQTSIRSRIKNARSLTQFLKGSKAEKFRTTLDELHEADIGEGLALKEIMAVEALFNHPLTIKPPITERVKSQAVEFALAKKAPFQNRNSMADALIVLSTTEYILQMNLDNAIFVSSNTQDFSSLANKTEIHEDLKEIFDKCKMRYRANIGQAINEIETDLVSTESVSEIEEAIQLKTIQSTLEDYQQTLRNMDFMGGATAMREALRTIDVMKETAAMKEALKAIDAIGGAAGMQEVLQTYQKTIDEVGGAAGMQEALRTYQKTIDAMGGFSTIQKTLKNYQQIMQNVRVQKDFAAIQESSRRKSEQSNQTRSRDVNNKKNKKN